MNEFFSNVLDLLSQFTGGRGGPRYLVVNYTIAAVFWGVLAAIAQRRRAERRHTGNAWLTVAFAFAAGRETLMIAAVALQTASLLDADWLLARFPPFEHALRDMSEILLAGAFLSLNVGPRGTLRGYVLTGFAAIAGCYAATAGWWFDHAVATPHARFDSTWCDWLFRSVISLWLAWAAYRVARANASAWRTPTVAALLLLLLYQSLKLVDMSLDGIYEGAFNPLRRWSYLAAAGVFAYAYARAVQWERGGELGALSSRIDALERRALGAETEKLWARAALNAIGDAVVTCSSSGLVTYLNMRAEEVTGWAVGDAIGLPLQRILVDRRSAEDVAQPHDLVAQVLRSGEAGRQNVCLSAPAGEGGEIWYEEEAAPIFDRSGKVAGAVFTRKDVTASQKLAARIVHQAQHDALTGLPNRVLLLDRIGQAVRVAERHRHPAALLFLDLDRFKNINDSLGHTVGDQVLRSVAERLVAAVRASDTVCRVGGDEFVLLIPEMEDARDGARLAEKLLATVSAPMRADDRELHVAASIGIALYPADGADVDTLLRAADAAMYHAKEAGRNTYEFFTPELRDLALSRLALEADLRHAVPRGELFLEFQPKVGAASPDLIGVEALVRWNRPGHGVVAPDDFIGVAEKSSLIDTIGEWVLASGCAQTRRWHQAGLHRIPVSINVSGVQFRRPGFLHDVARVLGETGLSPRFLELELTESALMEDSAHTKVTLAGLKSLGVRISVDDFGTGYSSLSYLRTFPIDCIKIDRSFVKDVHSDPEQAAIVRAIVSLAQTLRLETVAEGVETQAQRNFLEEIGCDGIQGFLSGEPAAPEAIADLLRTRPQSSERAAVAADARGGPPRDRSAGG